METLEDRIWARLPRAWLAWVLVSLLAIIYCYVAGYKNLIFGPTQVDLLRFGAISSQYIDQGEIWRLSSSLFLHGSLLHLVLNGLALLALCRMGEAIFGPVLVLVVLYFSGLVGAFLSWSMGASSTVGASGAIFGLLSALSIFGWKYKKELSEDLGGILRRQLGLFGLLNLFVGLWIPMIDNPSHFGGYITGGLLGLCLGHRWETGKNKEQVFWGTILLFAILVTIYSYV